MIENEKITAEWARKTSSENLQNKVNIQTAEYLKEVKCAVTNGQNFCITNIDGGIMYSGTRHILETRGFIIKTESHRNETSITISW